MKKILYIILAALLNLSAYAQTDPDVIEFAFISDTHRYGPTADVRYSDENIAAFVKYCKETPSIKFAIHGGDFMNAYDTNHKQAIFCLERGRQDFVGIGVPFYATKGNHDCNGKQRTPDGRRDGTQIVTDHEFFQIFSPLSPTNPLADSTDIIYDHNNREGNYYYRDFPQQKFRMIVLNDYDRDSLEYFGYHGLQVKWVAEKALNFMDKENPEDWCFIMLGHGLSVNMYEHPLNRVIHAYARGELLEDSDHGVSYVGDFHNQKRAKMVAFLAGHQHDDMYQRTEDYNMITMTRGFATGGEIESEPLSFSHFTLNVREKTLYEHRIGRGRDRLFSYAPHDQIWPVPSFTGAEGMGDLTNGGKGGRVITVTNLKDKGQGSLRWAIEQKGCRTIIFNVAGTINLKSPLVIDQDSISILGQTAPGEGVCLKGAPIKILASEVCVRYLHLRPGKEAGANVDAISDGDFGQHNIILDHISVSHFTGHGIAIRRAKDVTVQYCIVSHLLHENLDNTADAPAGILAGGFMATYYKNLVANCANAMMFPNEEGQNRWIHALRNMFFNWKDHIMYGGGKQGEITIEENYLLPGPATRDTTILEVAEDGTGRYYVSWNFVHEHPEFNGSNWKLIHDVPAMPYIPLTFDAAERAKMHPVQRPQRGDFGTTCTTIAAFHYKPVWSGKTAASIYRDIMMSVGCNRIRDSYDTQLINDVRQQLAPGGKDGLISAAEQGYAWPIIRSASEKKPQLTADDVYQWADDRVKTEKSIVILYETTSAGKIDMFPRLAGYRDAISADTAHVAVVGGGDFLFGDILATASHAKTIVDIMKYTKYDALTLGNMDFSYSVDDIKEIVKPLGPIITTCNLTDVKTKKPVFQPYIIRQYGNRKVAFVGITNPKVIIKYSASFSNEQDQMAYDIEQKNLIPYVQKAVDNARRAGADYVIAIPHIDDTGNDPGIEIRNIIEHTYGIDIVLAYGNIEKNCKINNINGNEVLYSSPTGEMNSISKIIIANDGLITTEVIPASKMLFKNSSSTHMLDSIKAQYSEFLSEKIADCQVRIQGLGEDGLYILGQETNGGDLISDAIYSAVEGCDVAFINAGSIRSNLMPGEITRSMILEMLPYENRLCSVKLSGAALQKLFDIVARDYPNHLGNFLHPSGLRYIVHKGKNASDIQVMNRYKGSFEPIDPDQTYNVVTTEFNVRDKNFNDVFLKNGGITEYKTLYSSALLDYIENILHGKIGERYSHPQRRIVFRD